MFTHRPAGTFAAWMFQGWKDLGLKPGAREMILFQTSPLHCRQCTGLQTLDTGLFHFINGSLGNPAFFDWLMPILSGHGAAVQFVPLAAMFRRRGAVFRQRACADLRVHGHPHVISARRRADHQHHQACRRARSCLALPDVIERWSLQPLRQHAIGARSQYVRRHDDSIFILPEKFMVHAAAGARRFIFACLC